MFLILWLKRGVVPTLPHEVIVADVVYPAVLLSHSRSLSLLPIMIGCLQSRLQVLCQGFCNEVVEEDNQGDVVVGSDGEPKVKTLNPRVELPYTYFMAWYVMHCMSLMSAVQSSEDFQMIEQFFATMTYCSKLVLSGQSPFEFA